MTRLESIDAAIDTLRRERDKVSRAIVKLKAVREEWAKPPAPLLEPAPAPITAPIPAGLIAAVKNGTRWRPPGTRGDCRHLSGVIDKIRPPVAVPEPPPEPGLELDPLDLRERIAALLRRGGDWKADEIATRSGAKLSATVAMLNEMVYAGRARKARNGMFAKPIV